MPTVFRWLARCPLWLLHSLGFVVGWLSYALSPSYRRRFGANAAQAGMAPAAARPAIAEAGRLLMELPYLWLRPASRSILPKVSWQGDALIDAAHAHGRSIVFMTPHLGCFEVTAQAYAERHGPITVLYRPARKAWLRDLVNRGRNRPGLVAVPANLAGVRQMLRALKRGEAVGLLPDQVPPDGMGVWAPFYGQPAYTMTLAARLVQQTGAALLMIWAERLPAGRGYGLRVSLPAQPLPTVAVDDAALQVACATAINHEMARLIGQCPEQYLWAYNRYKQPRKVHAATGDEAAP